MVYDDIYDAQFLTTQHASGPKGPAFVGQFWTEAKNAMDHLSGFNVAGRRGFHGISSKSWEIDRNPKPLLLFLWANPFPVRIVDPRFVAILFSYSSFPSPSVLLQKIVNQQCHIKILVMA